MVKNEKLTEPFKYSLTYGKDGKTVTENRTASGQELKNPQIHKSSFLIEAYFRTVAAHTGGVLVEKMGDVPGARQREGGYSLSVNRDGGLDFTVKGADRAVLASKTRIADGNWHHVIAEADRKTASLTLYVDGRKDATGPGVDEKTSLANNADLYVGGTPRGRCLAGSLDFVRISLGTLADASTTIEELYAWEFAGPFLRDFTGRAPAATGRDAGAIQSTD
jgi:hypothetical protein